MTFRLVTPRFCIVTDHEMVDNLVIGNDFKFNIKVADLAINTKMLNALNLVSLYADSYENNNRLGNPLIGAVFGYTEPPSTKEYAIRFFVTYLGAFINNEIELDQNDTLSIMVQDENIQNTILKVK